MYRGTISNGGKSMKDKDYEKLLNEIINYKQRLLGKISWYMAENTICDISFKELKEIIFGFEEEKA